MQQMLSAIAVATHRLPSTRSRHRSCTQQRAQAIYTLMRPHSLQQFASGEHTDRMADDLPERVLQALVKRSKVKQAILIRGETGLGVMIGHEPDRCEPNSLLSLPTRHSSRSRPTFSPFFPVFLNPATAPMATSTDSDSDSRTMRANRAVPDPIFVQFIIILVSKCSPFNVCGFCDVTAIENCLCLCVGR
jgi:hypothetical protein